MVKYRTIPLCLAWDMDRPFAQGVWPVYALCLLVALLVIRSVIRDYIHITFIAGYCDNCSVLPVIVHCIILDS